MPVIKVSGLPKQLGEGRFERVLTDYRSAIIASILSIAELGLQQESQVTVLFPEDLLHDRPVEIIVEIIGLYDTPERTPEVRRRLAESVGKVVQSFYPQSAVECFVTLFNPEQGFWST